MTPTKAVSVLDLERIALDVPGTRVARARAWPGVHARFSCLSAPGAITLVVIPDLAIPQPQPSAGLLRALKRYLHRRRMVTTMLDLVGPTYLAVSVRATVRLRRGAAPADVSVRIEQALNTFLNPLHGGPDGRGWPFGRPVYRAEILQLIDGVPRRGSRRRSRAVRAGRLSSVRQPDAVSHMARRSGATRDPDRMTMADTTDLAAGRVTYREGQRLTARDLLDDRARRMRLRQLHVRNLHETWGIATGFDVQAAGPAAVAIGPGYALDTSPAISCCPPASWIPVPTAGARGCSCSWRRFCRTARFPRAWPARRCV